MADLIIDLADGSHCLVGSEVEAHLIYKESFEEKCYDVAPLPENPDVIDAGANIGLYPVYVKRKYPSAKVLAFEPAPITFQMLQRNLK